MARFGGDATRHNNLGFLGEIGPMIFTMNPLQLPASLSALGPEELSNRFRAHLERSVYQDRCSTPAQRALADALTVDERRAMETLINETCAICNQIGSIPKGETFLQERAAWLSRDDRIRLLLAAGYLNR
jgi:hypothetical protein